MLFYRKLREKNKPSFFEKISTLNEHSDQSRIAKGTKIIGHIEIQGTFRLEGIDDGYITASEKVVIGKTGYIQGKLTCHNADFEGKSSGQLDISDTLTLKPSALIEGEILVGKLAVEPGATFNASCVMKSNLKSLRDAKGHEKGPSERSA